MKTKNSSLNRWRAGFTLLTAWLVLPLGAMATSYTWTGAAANANWGNTTSPYNWKNTVGGTAVLPTFNNTADCIITGSAKVGGMYIGANKTIEQLNYDAGSTTASTLALSTVLGPSASAASLTFDSSASTPSITISLGAAAHEIGVGTSAGAIGTVILNKDLTINHNGANSLTIDKAITGAHALTLNGSANNGVLILSGANTYSGATTIGSSGVMKLTGGSLGNTAITVNSGTLAVKPGAGTTISAGTTGVGTAGASLNLGANTFDMTDGAISTFNLQQNASFVGTALTIANGATLKFNLGNSTCDVLAVTGSASVSSTPTVTVDVSQATSWTGSPTFNVITAGSGLNSGSWAVSPATVTVGGQLYALSIAATAGAVTVTATPKFSVTYNGNNSDNDLNAPVDGSSPYSSGALVTVLGQGSLTKSGYNFAGWGTSSGGPVVYSWNGSAFSPASFTISANTTLYAQWAAATGPTQVRVETAADGSGSVVSAQNLASGSAITVYAISRTSGGAFVANVAADSWSLVNETGSVVSGDLVPAGDSKSAILTGNAAGTAKIHAVSGSLTSVDSGTITVLIPAAVTVETAADGSGTELAAQNVASGTSVTGYAISRTAGGAFVANVAATWSLANVSGGLVSGDLVAAGDSKSAVFTGHVIGSANIHAVSGALTSTDSGLLTVTFGTASKLAFTTQPSASTVVNAVFATQPVVSLEDQAGNVVTSGADSTVSVALTLSTGTGVLGGTTSVNAVNGVADFAGQGLNISLPGVNKVLTATATITAGTKTATTSPAFTITSLNLTWLGSPASYNWNTADVDWSGGNGGVYLDQASAVTFDDTGSDASPITLVGTLSPTSVTVNTSSRSYSFTGSGKIAGTGTTLTKSGSSTLTVTTANTYTGATILNGGELDATTSAKALGAGALTLSGGGTTLRLANDTGLNYGNNTTVSANMTIQSDVLTLGNPGVIHTNGTMSIGANTLTVAGGANVSSGTAGLTFGTTTLTGSPTFIVNNPSGGGTTLLTLGALTDATGNTIHLQGSGNVVQSAAWAVATGLQLDSTFTGMITLNQNNSGTPAWTGPITINGGTLYATGGGNRMGTGTLYLNGGTLDLSTGSGRAHTRNLTVGGNASILNGPQNHAAGNGATNSLQALSLGAYNLAVSSGLCNSGIEELDFGATTLTGSPTLTINSASAGGRCW